MEEALVSGSAGFAWRGKQDWTNIEIKGKMKQEVNDMYQEGMIVMMKKNHPCGGNTWKILRVGADFRIECTNCKRSVMISREDFTKRVKKIIST